MTALLEVESLRVRLPTGAGLTTVVDEIGYSVEPGEVFGIAGESGSGKTMSVLALMGLLPPGARTEGRALFGERDLLRLSRRELRRLNGRELSMVFQDPMTSLHPMLSIGTQLTEHVRRHLGLGRKEAAARALELLAEVRIPNPEGALDAFPHQFSGGMRQRIMIAMALMLEPALLIADEPTSALDVTLEAQIIELLKQLRAERGTAILFISHDLGVVAQICDRVVVMYAGRAVEEGDVISIFERPLHPYTRALLASVPSRKHRGERLATIPGRVPSLSALPPGCKFVDRCPYAQDVSREREPRYVQVDGRRVRCDMYDPASGWNRDAAPPDAVRAKEAVP